MNVQSWHYYTIYYEKCTEHSRPITSLAVLTMTALGSNPLFLAKLTAFALIVETGRPTAFLALGLIYSGEPA